MKASDVQALVAGMAPVIRQFVADEIKSRLAAAEPEPTAEESAAKGYMTELMTKDILRKMMETA